MNMIDRIPDNFLIESELTLEQARFLIEQINRFNILKEGYKKIGEFSVSDNGEIVLDKGTLIHGMRSFDENKINSIADTGILTGQAVGVSEDGETYYCADFHRVKEDITVEEYNNNFKTNDGRCPFGKKRADISNCVAFVVVPDDRNRELFSYDCYREGTKESEITRSFINNMPIVDKELGSSILYGVPSNCIDGIIVGGQVLNDKNKIDFLMNKFPRSYIITAHGELIYNPNKQEKKDDEIVELRRMNALLFRDKRIATDIVADYERKVSDLKEQYDDLWNYMFECCRNEDIAKVLNALGWQGDINSDYVENMKKGYKR